MGLLPFCLTIIHAFCEMLSYFFREKGRVPSHLVVSLVSTIHILINTCKCPCGVTQLNCTVDWHSRLGAFCTLKCNHKMGQIVNFELSIILHSPWHWHAFDIKDYTDSATWPSLSEIRNHTDSATWPSLSANQRLQTTTWPSLSEIRGHTDSVTWPSLSAN